jgi:hypothetical protein
MNLERIDEIIAKNITIRDQRLYEGVFDSVLEAVSEENEACAKVCEGLRPSKPEYDQRFNDGCTLSAAAIRARGET